MAQWKKVLVSGSDIHVSSITASNVPEGSGTDRVLVRDASTGGFKSVAQSSIQGTTLATFQISGSGTNDTSSFDGTGDILVFSGSSGTTVDITQDSTTTTVTVNLPENTISGSGQITLANTIGFSDFSASFAASISGNLASIEDAETNINALTTSINGLVASSSQLIDASASIASDLNTQGDNISALQSEIAALELFTSSVVTNDQTGSFVVSSSVIGTTNEIEVTANGAQGLTIGLPNNVTIPGILEAEALVIQGENVTETSASIISGSTIFGSLGSSNTHQFTGSLQITGGLSIDNTNTNVTITNIDVDNTVGISDIVARSTTDGGRLHTAGGAIATAISGAFTELSSSFATTIEGLSSATTTTNTTNIAALQTTSQSLLDSASLGIRLEHTAGDNNAGSSLGLGNTASFQASGDGLSISANNIVGDGLKDITFTYNINATTIGNTIGAFSSSNQLQDELDSIYVKLSDAPISGAVQLQTLGFITASDFNELVDVPSGLISGVFDGTTTQGTIKTNAETVSIFGLGESDSPTFSGLTITNDLTINGSTTAFQVDNLNIEDQFILINSGAGDTNLKDGGIIVDGGDGSGALFMYDFTQKAWGFKGATDDAAGKVNYNATSNNTTAIEPDVFVGTVSSSAETPSAAPAYGTGATQKGQMHINTADSSIWIYV